MNHLINISNTIKHVVTKKDLASNWGNNVEVLATPILLWLSEINCMKVIENNINDTEISVGASHEVEHLAPSPLGFEIELTATLIKIEGKKLVFKIEAYDKEDKILYGIHERFIVNEEKFKNRVVSKKARG